MNRRDDIEKGFPYVLIGKVILARHKKKGAALAFRVFFPLILSFSLGEKESTAVPAWWLKAAVTDPVASAFIDAGSVLPLPQAVGKGEGERRIVAS